MIVIVVGMWDGREISRGHASVAMAHWVAQDGARGAQLAKAYHIEKAR